MENSVAAAAPRGAALQPNTPLAATLSGGPFSAIPGLILTAGVAAIAFGLREIPGMAILSPMILATLIGMLFHNFVGTPGWAIAGVKFSLRRILRLGIILLGLQLMASQVMQVGLSGAAVILTTLVATFFFTKWIGHVIGAERKLTELIAAGTSICGASAVIATNTPISVAVERTQGGRAAARTEILLLPVTAPDHVGHWGMAGLFFEDWVS